MLSDDTNLRRWQRRFLAGAALLVPISPALWLQGQWTRRKVGLLPDAEGERSGLVAGAGTPAKLLVLGESTVAGLGARDHTRGLAGQFALQLSMQIDRPVEWHVIGLNGVTARRVIDELVPRVPNETFDYILLGIGGNDVMKLSSPRRWRRDMLELIGILRDLHPEAVIFISNCPMIIASPVIPQPIKGLLWELSQMHNANIIEFTRGMRRVFYYPQPVEFEVDGFFADGIHPSEKGYADWAAAMMKHFSENHEW